MNKSTLFVLVVSLLFGAPALAQPHAPALSNVLSAQDLEMAFENDGKPMELALLSEQEMRETEGAVISDLIARITFGGVSGGAVYFMSYFGSPDFSYRGFAEAVGAGAFGGLFGLTRGGQVILGSSTSAALGRMLDLVPTDG